MSYTDYGQMMVEREKVAALHRQVREDEKAWLLLREWAITRHVHDTLPEAVQWCIRCARHSARGRSTHCLCGHEHRMHDQTGTACAAFECSCKAFDADLFKAGP